MENYTSNEASALRFCSVKKYKWWRIVIAAKRKKVKIKKEEKIQQASATIISHSRRPGVKPRDIGRVSEALRNFLAGRLAMTAIFPIRCIQRRCARKIRAHSGLYRGSRSNKLVGNVSIHRGRALSFLFSRHSTDWYQLENSPLSSSLPPRNRERERERSRLMGRSAWAFSNRGIPLCHNAAKGCRCRPRLL